MKSYLLSIVLPIYNVEKYLEKCLKSILDNKKSDEIEILLIDDGSTDNSSDICDDFASRYKNIIAYHKENGGLSDARNYGLFKATGKYVWFVDSDDLITPNAINVIIDILAKKDVDILLGDAEIIDENGNIINNSVFEYKHKGLKDNCIYDGKDIIIKQIEKNDYYQTTVWLGVYKKSFLIKNALLFEKGLIHEDEMWSPKVFLNSQKIIYIKKNIYYYRIRENSIMRERKNNEKHINAFIYIFSTLTDYILWKVEDKELQNILNDNISKRYLHAIAAWEFVKYPKLMKKVDRKKIYKQSKSKKNTIRAMILAISPKLYSKISSIFTKKKKGDIIVQSKNNNK